MSLTDNMIHLYKHQFKMSYKIILSLKCISWEDMYKLKIICKNKFIITHDDNCDISDIGFNFYYNNKCYDVWMTNYSIYISYIDITSKNEIIDYLMGVLNIKDKLYKQCDNGFCAISTLNMKIYNKQILNFDILNSINNNTISLDLNCETFINKQHGGLCIKGNNLSDIIEVYTEIYTIIKLPIVLKSLFKCKNSLFYYLPYELKNVILSFM